MAGGVCFYEEFCCVDIQIHLRGFVPHQRTPCVLTSILNIVIRYHSCFCLDSI